MMTALTPEQLVDLKDKVFKNLNTATIDNGYDFAVLSLEEIANDLCDYSTDFADMIEDPEILVPFIDEWKRTKA
jgi:hypothetical protein